MVWVAYFLVLAFSAICFWMRGLGLDQRLFEFFLFFALILLIPFYFMSRAGKEPSRTEAVLAAVWIFIRRLVGLVMTLALVGGAYAMFLNMFRHGFSFATAAGVVFILAMAGWVLWKSWYGEGPSSGFSDDRPSHEARKKRYGWK